jgi:hypothetical protein
MQRLSIHKWNRTRIVDVAIEVFFRLLAFCSRHKEFMNPKKKAKINIRYISTSESTQEQTKASAFK